MLLEPVGLDSRNAAQAWPAGRKAVNYRILLTIGSIFRITRYVDAGVIYFEPPCTVSGNDLANGAGARGHHGNSNQGKTTQNGTKTERKQHPNLSPTQ